MKKRIAMFLAATSLFTLVSCTKPIPSDTAFDTTAETTTGVDITPTDTAFKAYYPIGNAFSETPTRVLYVHMSFLRYYNKFTEENNIFCFDPLCRHSGPDECIAHKFMMADSSLQSIEYCEYDNRFYALRGAQFCSFAFDGSDLKVEHSFGEEGKFGSNRHGVYMFGDLLYLSVHDKFVYFYARDNESGKHALTRFDVETKKIERIFYDENTNFGGYFVCEDKIYISMAGEYSGLYRAELDGSGLEKISDNIYVDLSEGIFDGERMYLIESDGLHQKIVAFCPESNTFADLLLIEDDAQRRLLAATEQYLFFTKREPVSVGFHESHLGKDEIFNYTSKIYRLDKESGEIVTVLDNIRCSTRMLYFIEDTVILLGSGYVPDETNASSNGAGFTAKLDEKGIFTELTRMED